MHSKATQDLFTLINGENGVMLSFEKQSTSSTAEVTANISETSDPKSPKSPPNACASSCK